MIEPGSQRFAATCYLPGSSGGQPCLLEMSPQGLRVWTQDALLTEWHYPDLLLDSAGDDRSFLVITNSNASETTAPSVVVQDPQFRSLLASRMEGSNLKFLQSFDTRTRSIVQRQWINLVLAAAAFIGLMVAGYYGLTSVVANWAARKMPVPVEVKWGRLIAATFLADKKIVSEGSSVDACAVILARLTNALESNPGYPFSLHVVRSDMVNALALPGGQMVVFTGLLEKASSPDEVAGVFAHEIQHILQRHVVKRLVSSLGGRALVMAVFGGGNLSTVAVGTSQILSLSYGRSQEREADLYGLRLMARAGIPPEAMASFFEQLRHIESIQLPQLVSTHPATDDRISDIRKAGANLKSIETRSFDMNWKRIQDSLRD